MQESRAKKDKERVLAEERELLTAPSAVAEDEVAEVVALDNEAGTLGVVGVVVLGDDDVVPPSPCAHLEVSRGCGLAVKLGNVESVHNSPVDAAVWIVAAVRYHELVHLCDAPAKAKRLEAQHHAEQRLPVLAQCLLAWKHRVVAPLLFAQLWDCLRGCVSERK